MRGIAGKVAVVTGAAGGIGQATARRLAEEGATVVCWDVSEELLEPVIGTLAGSGLQVSGQTVDVGDRQGTHEAMAAVADQFGAVDILANVHGVYHQAPEGVGPVEAEAPEDWERVLGINLMGVVHTVEGALAHMKARRRGRIVSVSSMAALNTGSVSGAAYAVSKAGVACFMKCVAREGAEYGITANSVAPGHIDTAMTKVVRQRVPESVICERTPLGRLGEPEEVASTIAFLSSDDASFITGAMVSVNGGQLMT